MLGQALNISPFCKHTLKLFVHLLIYYHQYDCMLISVLTLSINSPFFLEKLTVLHVVVF